jgi:oxygen-independent coproporphyrinogen-3 oxidase
MYLLGVNRISFGVQSFDAKKLQLLNRAHTPQMAHDALLRAKSIGYTNLSLDLIYGVAGDTRELLHKDIDTALLLPINHLSAYALTIENNTPFAKTPQMAHERVEDTQSLFDAIHKHGFTQYEVSNFGTYQSRHNLGYWEYKEYIGAGAGAVGRCKNTRLYPQSEIEAYIKNPLLIQEEDLSDEDQRTEKIFLGLRSCVGVNTQLLRDEEKIRASILIDEKKLLLQEGILYNQDYLLADEIALFLSS